MTANQFRKAALTFPDTAESSHMAHPDFRVRGKIFATLGYPDASCGAVMLPVEEQKRLMNEYPKVFEPAKGAWGRSGSTVVKLDLVDAPVLRQALSLAWQNKAPASLRKDFPKPPSS